MELYDLITECKHQSLPAQKCLYHRYAGAFFLLCRRYLRSTAEAEEAMLSGFLKLFTALPRFRYVNDAATEAWFKRIMVTECLMHLRASQNFLLSAADELPDVPAYYDPLDGLSATEIFRLVTQLPTGYRTVFNLFAVEGYSHAEIATALGISEATSRSQLSKARALLQQQIIKTDADHAWRKTK